MPKHYFFLIIFLSINARADFIAHEWGTFTSLVGSNGIRQDGMYHEDELLPNFVHHYGEDYKLELPNRNVVAFLQPHPSTPTRPRPPHLPPGTHKLRSDLIGDQTITQKMETPVLYFYADEAQHASVDVAFPEGVIAESYPQAIANYPLAANGVVLKNGFSHYEISILTNSEKAPIAVDAGNIYSHARNVKSNLIKSNDEIEKFIFYRGVGNFKTDLTVTSNDQSITLSNNGKNIPQAFILNFNGVTGDIHAIGQLDENNSVSLNNSTLKNLQNSHLSFADYIKKSRALLLLALVKNGLYDDEAKAMLDTWEQSYLKNPGLRVLYVLNRNEVERILPMNITPTPKDLKRVFIGRIEVLTQHEEQKLFKQVLNEGGSFKIESLGRMAQPIANRLLEMAKEKKLSEKSLEIFNGLVRETSQI